MFGCGSWSLAEVVYQKNFSSPAAGSFSLLAWRLPLPLGGAKYWFGLILGLLLRGMLCCLLTTCHYVHHHHHSSFVLCRCGSSALMPVDLFLCLFIAGAVLLSLSIMLGYFVWYNIGWISTRFNNLPKHEKQLSQDLNQAIEDYDPSGIFLSECGEVAEGLPIEQWTALLERILPVGYQIWCHSHYTCILKLDDVIVIEAPSLSASMCTLPGHEFRRCQKVVVQFRNSAGKPIALYNVHSPASKKHPLGSYPREQIMNWFGELTSERTLIGGDLNMSEHSLHEHLKKYSDTHFLFEDGHKHGDVVLVKGYDGAESVACDISSTTDAHRMCVMSVPRIPNREALPSPAAPHSAAKPAGGASGEASEDAKAKAKAKAGETATPATGDSAAQRRGAKRAGGEYEEASEAAKAKAKTEAGKDATSATEGSAEKSSAAKPTSKGAGDDEKKPEAKPLEETPLLDIMFKAVGERMDESQAERELFGHLAAQLWTGSFTSPPRSAAVTNPRCSKMRLERLLMKVLLVREVYQQRAFNDRQILDRDLDRSLTEAETRVVHNLYMNDVGAWMNAEALGQYRTLIAEADMEDKGKGKSAGGKKGKGKTTVKSARQRAQQLKKQRFNKVLNDDAANKAFFMTLVRHPMLMRVEHLVHLVNELKEVKASREYQDMLAASAKKSDDEKELKRKRDEARVQLNRGKAASVNGKLWRLAAMYDSGELQDRYEEAEKNWSRVKQSGVAVLLGPRMGE